MKTDEERISAATTELAELELVETALSIDISLAHRDKSSFPRLADEVEALVATLSISPPPGLVPWTVAEARRVAGLGVD